MADSPGVNLGAVALETAALLRNRFVAADEIVGEPMAIGLVHGQWTLEMTLEAFCEWHVVDPAGGWLDPVDWVWEARGWRPGDHLPWHRRPVAAHEDALARARGDERVAEAFVSETALMLEHDRMDDDGLVIIWDYRLPERRPLHVDYMHEFGARLASAAALGGDASWFDVAVHQYVGYAGIMRDPQTGLWHLARGWGEKPDTLSPGAWSRGHGWLLRGMVEMLRWLPAEHPGRESVRSLLVQTVESLAPLQDDGGMWHVLLHRPWSDSEGETSGTALIGFAIAAAVAEGELPADPWARVAEDAIAAVCSQVDERGVVSGVCTTPGLTWDEDELRYLRRPLAVGDPHGVPTVLYACLGEQLLASRA